MRGDYSAAGQYYQESLALKREAHDRYGIAASLNNLGIIAYDQGDLGTAQRLCEESLALGRELGGKLHTSRSAHEPGENRASARAISSYPRRTLRKR